MDKNKIIEYSNKYKKAYKKFSVIISIFIFIIGAILIGAGLFIIINIPETYIYVVGGIMIGLAIFDVILGIKFLKFSLKKADKTPDKYAAEKYMKIMGIHE